MLNTQQLGNPSSLFFYLLYFHREGAGGDIKYR